MDGNFEQPAAGRDRRAHERERASGPTAAIEPFRRTFVARGAKFDPSTIQGGFNMTRQQLEHIIRAAAANADVKEIVVVGSQAILGAFPNAPPELLESIEADVYPKDNPSRSDVIDGGIGEASIFHQTFGYYAHGVDETTAILPDDWQTRLIRVETPATGGAVGWCLEPHDLAVSKLAAGREHDLEFVAVMFRHRLVSSEIVGQRIARTSRLTVELKQLALDRLTRAASVR